MPRRLKHTRIKNGKLQLFVRVHAGPGGLKTKTVERTIQLAEIQAWVDDQRLKFSGGVEGGLSATIATYLASRTAMPTLEQHTAHLALWTAALGADRPPMSVTTEEITGLVDRWMHDGLANDTIRKRRSALRTFYNRTFPKRVNPVKGSLNPKEPKPEARGLSYVDVEAAITAMPIYRDTKPGAPRAFNLARLRCRVMAYTGLPPGIVGKLRPQDISLVAGTVRVAGREKGDGIEPRTLNYSDSADAMSALKDFHAANAYGRFALGSCNRSLKRGFKKIGIDPRTVRQYDLRHSFLSQVYRVTRDEATVQRLGLHAPGSRCTARYTKAAHSEIDAAATAAFSESLERIRRESMKPAPQPKPAARTTRKTA